MRILNVPIMLKVIAACIFFLISNTSAASSSQKALCDYYTNQTLTAASMGRGLGMHMTFNKNVGFSDVVALTTLIMGIINTVATAIAFAFYMHMKFFQSDSFQFPMWVVNRELERIIAKSYAIAGHKIRRDTDNIMDERVVKVVSQNKNSAIYAVETIIKEKANSAAIGMLLLSSSVVLLQWFIYGSVMLKNIFCGEYAHRYAIGINSMLAAMILIEMLTVAVVTDIIAIEAERVAINCIAAAGCRSTTHQILPMWHPPMSLPVLLHDELIVFTDSDDANTRLLNYPGHTGIQKRHIVKYYKTKNKMLGKLDYMKITAVVTGTFNISVCLLLVCDSNSVLDTGGILVNILSSVYYVLWTSSAAMLAVAFMFLAVWTDAVTMQHRMESTFFNELQIYTTRDLGRKKFVFVYAVCEWFYRFKEAVAFFVLGIHDDVPADELGKQEVRTMPCLRGNYAFKYGNTYGGRVNVADHDRIWNSSVQENPVRVLTFEYM